MELRIKKMHPEAVLPSYAHPGDAGFDLRSAIDATLAPGERLQVPVGLAMEIPEGFVGLVWDKSGLALRNGVTNMAGVIDAGYRGEVAVVLYNAGAEPYEVRKGDKVAQMLIQPVSTVSFVETGDLSDTSRGDGAWGSTGK